MAILLAWPLELLNFGDGMIIATCDVVAVIMLLHLVKARFDKVQLLFVAAFVLSCFSILYRATALGADYIRPILSLVYFFKPYIAFFVAGWLARKAGKDGFVLFLQKFAIASTFFIAASFATILMNWNSFRTGFDFFGIKVFGVEGMNGFAVYLVICIGVIWSAMTDKTISKKLFLLLGSGIVLSLLILSIALSRQAILGMVLIVGLVFVGSIFRNPIKTLVFFLGIGGAGFYAVSSGAVDLSIWQDRMFWTFEAIRTGDLDLLSNGRLSITGEMLSHLKANPVFGTGFSGWGAHTDSIDAAINQGFALSPHNQWIGAAWKMGLLAFLPYFLAVISAYSLAMAMKSDRVSLAVLKATLTVCLLFFGNTQDVLLYPLSGYLILMVLGFMSVTSFQNAMGRSRNWHAPISPSQRPAVS